MAAKDLILEIAGPPKGAKAPAGEPDGDEMEGQEEGLDACAAHLESMSEAMQAGDFRAAAEAFKRAMNC